MSTSMPLVSEGALGMTYENDRLVLFCFVLMKNPNLKIMMWSTNEQEHLEKEKGI